MRRCHFPFFVLVAGCAGESATSQSGPAATDVDGGALHPRNDAGAVLADGDASKPDAFDASPTHGSSPPAPAHAGAACVVSVDCAAGLHCDLGECVQDCSTQSPCAAPLACTARGRCATPGEADHDPPPTLIHAGDVDASPSTLVVAPGSTSVSFRLTSTSADTVRYRLEVNAPYLRARAPRGEFVGSTDISLDVVAGAPATANATGSIRVLSTLGDLTVNAPLGTGPSGTYRGILRYVGGSANLGDAQIAIDLLEKNGDALARIDSNDSLLFPNVAKTDAIGSGRWTAADGFDVTIDQVLPADFGGARNHLRRPLGRKVHLLLKPKADGALDGTFTDTFFGLFGQPVTTEGAVVLQRDAQSPTPALTFATPVPSMPDGPQGAPFYGPGDIFGWASDCETTLFPNASARAAQLATMESVYAKDLLGLGTPDSNPFETVVASCKEAAAETSRAAWEGSTTAQSCTLAPVLGCALNERTHASVADTDNGRAFAGTLAKFLEPSVLLAKNEVVAALYDSFTKGLTAELGHYDDAIGYLMPTLTWATHPALLEYLRNLPSSSVKGETPAPLAGAAQAPPTNGDSFPAARGLMDIFYTLALIDGERARLGAASQAGAQPALASETQERAVFALVDAVIVAELGRSWGSLPSSVTYRSVGVLTPLNEGFRALLEGSLAFGVPAGFVPFVYRPENVSKGATNFEQMLALTTDSLGMEARAEGQFIQNKRAYDQDYKQMQTEISAVRDRYDTQIKDICGTSFDPNAVRTDSDWNGCGTGGEGTAGQLANDIALSDAQLQSEQSRIEGGYRKLNIDWDTLEANQNIHADTVRFIKSTGEDLDRTTLVEGVLSGLERGIEISANSNLLNGGAPLAMAPVVYSFELAKAALSVERNDLMTKQTMHAEVANGEIEYNNGMANLQKELIDLAQMDVDIVQNKISAYGARLRRLNALAQAKNIFVERQKALTLIGKDPTRDPTYRLLRDQNALATLASRADAQKQLFIAASALEYEINMSIAGLAGAVESAHDTTSLETLHDCLLGIYDQTMVVGGSGNGPQDYYAVVSVRRMLGITGPRVDAVTGQVMSEGDQFRDVVLRSENIDPASGGIKVSFPTNLQPGNLLWSSDVCADKISGIQGELVGDFLGDNRAQINIELSGGGVLRACDSDALETWSLGPPSGTSSAFAVVQSGVNTFGDVTNTSMFGQPVARATWKVTVPGAAGAPDNYDVDVRHLDDIVLKVFHRARSRSGSAMGIDLSCLSTIGK